MPAERKLSVNADDFGQSPGVNRGIIRAHGQGIVTSASLMVRWPAAADAAAYARNHPGLGLGLHIDLGEWSYHDGEWFPLYEVVPLDDAGAVAAEVARQLAAFRDLTGRDPTHIDSHQHAHREEPVRSAAVEMARDIGIPLRHSSPDIRYCGEFYGQGSHGTPLPGAVSVERLIAILAALPPGITELGCHPGETEDLATLYRRERSEEVRTLCDPRVRGAITEFGIELCSFASATCCLGNEAASGRDRASAFP